MRVLRSSDHIDSDLPYPIVTIGNYDGVHIGHQKIIKLLKSLCSKKKGTAIVYTFSPHPAKVLAPKVAPSELQTEEQKVETLEKLGVDIVFIENFTKSFAKLTPDEFFRKVIVNKLKAREMIVGYDFTFGLKRRGTTKDLLRLADKYSIKPYIADAIFTKNTLISSTHIRHYVRNGKMEAAAEMLGRPYSIEGKVISGRGIGSKIGYHTANLSVENEIIPATGVYITKSLIEDKSYPSVTNIGYNPTVETNRLSVETHILDFSDNILGKRLELFFYKTLREEEDFKSIDDLRSKIDDDITKTRKYYEERI